MTDLMTTLSHLLCPAGEGVFTVHAGEEKRQQLQARLYGSDVRKTWLKQLTTLTTNHSPLLLGICSDAGGGILRGANWGPLYLRQALYEHFPNLQYFDLGDVRVIPQLLLDEYLSKDILKNCKTALYNDASSPWPVSPLSITEKVVHDIYQYYPDKKIFAIGGDHSVSYPLVKTFLRSKQRQNIKCAVIHFDAHTDLSAQRMGIPVCFGTWAYHILEYLPAPQQLIQVGIRSSAQDKTFWQNKLGIKQFWQEDIQQEGLAMIIDNLIHHLKTQHIEECYISFDIDCIDMAYASATGTPEKNGLTPDEAIRIINAIAKHTTITGADMMEIAPHTQTNKQNKEPETTLYTAAKISAELLKALQGGQVNWQTNLPNTSISWLNSPDSTTKRFRKQCKKMEITVLSQTWQSAQADEASYLGLNADQDMFIREIYMLCDNKIILFGRTVIPKATLEAQNYDLKQLDNKSLGDIIYRDPSMQRSAFEFAQLNPNHFEYQRAIQTLNNPEPYLWARRSIIRLNNQPLLLTEVAIATNISIPK